MMGTRLFPLSPKQERVHFDVATKGSVDHYDGEPNQAYQEDIKKFMARTFSGWDHQPESTSTFLQDWSTTRGTDFNKKFPFAIHRFDDKCFTKKEWECAVMPGAIEHWNTPAKSQPANLTGGWVVAGANIRTKSDPRTSAEEIRLAKVSVFNN